MTLGITLENCARTIRERWRSLPRRRADVIADDGPAATFGYAQTLRRVGVRLAETVTRVEDAPDGLARWTPPVEELHARLRQADLEIVRSERPEARLDLTVARPVNV
ncbi:hypothetical protein [Frankia sp. AgKG'84/4]|uniref:hypothetical protein n=1 Tax=Frankia sp. AgKG'84/4 TaxID=573490 RepID=UPI00200BD0DA|nr:hypothetical protein [Frankia sp. AgKG'84/4]MCL9794569.1 hypothetical protein [Frankia sp. AgKG'84/4]